MSKKEGAKEIKTLKFREHVQSRSMWLGSTAVTPHEIWVYNHKKNLFTKETIEYSDALYKCIDEIIVNALDQYINTVNLIHKEGGPVTTIKIGFDEDTGTITVYNDGQGMPVYLMDDVEKGGQIWTVEAIISRERTGSNFNDNEDPDRVTGGINGLGIKLVNVMSSKLEIETVDWHHMRYYRQSCEDGMNVVNPPFILDMKKDKSLPEYKTLKGDQLIAHTTVKFTPNYDHLCTDGDKKSKTKTSTAKSMWYTKKRGVDIARIVEARAYQLAAFIAATNYRYSDTRMYEYKIKGKVFFNDKRLDVKTFTDYVDLFGLRNYATIELRDKKGFDINELEDQTKHIKFPWSIAINISQNAILDAPTTHDSIEVIDESESETPTQDEISYKKFEQLNLVNGVYLPNGGSHINFLLDMIEDALHPKIEKLLGQKFRDDKNKPKALPAEILRNNLFVLNCIQIPLPQFTGQTKDAITLKKSDLADFKNIYTLPPAFIKRIWELLKPILEFKFIINDKNKKPKKTKKNFVRKYHKAKKLGLNSKCVVPEGDSAEGTMKSIITNKKAKLGFTNYALYNIQGVPMNALKQIKEITVGSHSKIKQSRLLQENVALQGLVQVLGLNYDYTYYYVDDETLKKMTTTQRTEQKIMVKQGDKEFESLNYGCLIVAVDQDVDGIGQIFGLILTFFMVFFPNLIKRGFIKRFATPLIRVYPKSAKEHVLEFYSLAEFKQWRVTRFGSTLSDSGAEAAIEDAETVPKNLYRVKYYKGLATHSKEEVQNMAENFESNIYTYRWDEMCKKYMEIMYGNATKLRKDELRTPVTAAYDQNLYEKQVVKISDQFQIETKTFQLDFLERKLPSAIDGMIPAQRKAFAGARQIWSLPGKKEMKVYQLTGYVTEKLHYQHGGAAMDETITKMAQTFTGANTMPLLIPISNGFGDRDEGRGKTGQARYIEVKLNSKLTDVMFPRIDDFLLEYAYDDGEKCEPKYVPIMPMALLNTCTTVSVGWRIHCWARDFKFTLEQVRQMIKYDWPHPAAKPRSFNEKVWLEPGMSITYTLFGDSSKKPGEVCLGTYEYNPGTNIVKVTQLPLKIWSYPYRCELLGVTPYKENTTTNLSGTPLPNKDLVDDVIDETGNNLVHMEIKLKPGAYEQICDKYGTTDIDPLEDYLGLKQNMAHELNMISKDGTVIEFANYSEVLEHWFPVRKELYINRLERQRLLLEFEIIFHEQVQRYIDMEKKGDVDLNDISPEDQIAQLEDHKFVKLNDVLLFAPKFTKTHELRSLIFESSKSTYSYIIDKITKGMSSTKAIAIRKEKIAALKEELEKLMTSTYKDIWLAELEQLEKIVEEGIRTKWMFGMKQHKFKKVTAKQLKDVKKINNSEEVSATDDAPEDE
jgi:DNA topoisomerase-2